MVDKNKSMYGSLLRVCLGLVTCYILPISSFIFLYCASTEGRFFFWLSQRVWDWGSIAGLKVYCRDPHTASPSLLRWLRAAGGDAA